MPRTFSCNHRNEEVAPKRNAYCANCGKRIEWREIVKIGGRNRKGAGTWIHSRTLSTTCEPTVATPNNAECYHDRSVSYKEAYTRATD